MTITAITFNQVSDIKIFHARGKRSGKRGGGSGLKAKGVQDVMNGQSEAASVIERLESGSSVSLSRKQRKFCNAFVRAVAQRRAAEKNIVRVAPSRFTAPMRKAG